MTTNAELIPQAEERVQDSQTSSETRPLPCSSCGTDDPTFEYASHEDKHLCIDCYDEQVSLCAGCENPFWRDNTTRIADERYCENCLNERFRFCSGCDAYYDRERVYYSELHDADYCESCFSSYVTYCTSCDGQIDPENCRVNDNGDSFCEECYEHDGDDPDGIEYQEHDSVRFEKCLSRRKYGVEIEVVTEEDSSHLPYEQLGCWKQVHDGSLGNEGREYVSPILHGDDGFEEIEKFTARLKEWGYVLRRNCGLHVHIDGRDLGCEEIKLLLKIVRYFEPVIYAMLPNSRRDGTYSVPLEKFPKSRFRISAKDEDALKRLWYGNKERNVNLKSKYHHSRYYGLNIHSWFFRRSLEFRYHSGTLNPLKITNFITICQSLVDQAKAVSKFRMAAPTNFRSHLDHFADFLKLSDDIAHYVRQRITKFHPERFSDLLVLSPSQG